MSVNLSLKEWNDLSLYLDNALDVRQREALEKQIQKNPDLQAGLVELRKVKTILKHAPRYRAPRSFVLSPGMVERKKRWSFPTLFPSLGFGLASVISIILAVVMFTSRAQMLAAPSAMMMAAPREAESATGAAGVEESPVPIIIWGNTEAAPQLYKSVPDEAAGAAPLPTEGFGGGPVSPEPQPEPTLPPVAEKSIPQATEETNPDFGIQGIETPAADASGPMGISQEPVTQPAPAAVAAPSEAAPAATTEPAVPTETEVPPAFAETPPPSPENVNPILGIQPTVEAIPALEVPVGVEQNVLPSPGVSPLIPAGLLIFGGICAIAAIISFRKARS